jgi:S1-C subfamily serine protease
MNLVDLIAILLLLGAAMIGARAGFLGPILGLAGAAGGFLLALLVVAVAQPALAEIEQPLRALVALVGLAFLVLFGEATGAGIGATVSRYVHPTWMRPIDLAGGALVGVAHAILLLWLVGGMLAAGVAPNLARQAQGSVALGLVHETFPPPSTVAGRLVALFEATELPRLFHGLEPRPAPPVDLPDDAQARALAESAIPSTVRVDAAGCAQLQVGSGFFVRASQVVTNAHVVAGSERASVTHGGTTLTATVVYFDADMDLALLDVPGAQAPALELAGQEPQRGQAAVAIGFPGGGPLAVSPAAVAATYDAVGPDIYGAGRVSRPVVEMRAQIVQGNSGGPLVTAPGVAGGVVFGGSRADAGVGYAISAPTALASIGPAFGRTAAADTGPCR